MSDKQAAFAASQVAHDALSAPGLGGHHLRLLWSDQFYAHPRGVESEKRESDPGSVVYLCVHHEETTDYLRVHVDAGHRERK